MAPIKVLIADDNPVTVRMVEIELGKHGYEVVGKASDGTEAVEIARELRPDIVILDVKMPRMTGIEAAQILANEQIAPVLLLTAVFDHDTVQKSVEAGVYGYLCKPFRQEDLAPAVEVALARYKESSTNRITVDTARYSRQEISMPEFDHIGAFNQSYKALLASFTYGELRILLRTELGVRIEEVASGETLSEIVFNLVDWAYRTGNLNDVMCAALKVNPKSPSLETYFERYSKK